MAHCKLVKRVRQKSNFSPFRGKYQAKLYCNSNLVTVYPPSYLETDTGVSEYIEDEVLAQEKETSDGPKLCYRSSKRFDKAVFKNVYHEKLDRQHSYDEGVYYTNKLNHCYNYELSIHSMWWFGRGGATCAHYIPELALAPVPSIDVQKLYSAIGRMEPSFENFIDGVNLWNIIFELGQLKGLLGTFVMNTKSLTENVADKHLGYSFGIAPLQGDIGKIINIIDNLDSVIDKWNALADKSQVIDFHEFIDTNEILRWSASGNTDVSHVSGSGETTSRYDLDLKEVSRVHCYGYAKRIPNNKRFKVMIRALGLDKPITGAWEAVPFSWVVDYFTNIGDMISTWEQGLGSMFQMKVVSAGFSVKRTYKAQVRLSDDMIPELGYSGNMFKGSIEESGTVYQRQRLPHRALFRDARAKLTQSMEFGMFLGWRQASYLGAVAYLSKGR